MSQTFLDYNGQVDKLINEKQLIVADRSYAIDMLKKYSYFSLIGGYKNIFINKSAKKYKRGGSIVQRKTYSPPIVQGNGGTYLLP